MTKEGIVFNRSSQPAGEKMLLMNTPRVCPKTPGIPSNGTAATNESAMRT